MARAKTAKTRAKPEASTVIEARERLVQLVNRLSLRDLEASLPVLQKHVLGVPFNAPRTIEFEEVVEAFELLGDLLTTPSAGVQTCDCGELACFIWNEGFPEEVTEALLALVPIARRVKERWDKLEQARLDKFKHDYAEAGKTAKAGAVRKVKKATARARR